MTDKMKNRIRKNVNLIDDGNFDDFYKDITTSTSSYGDVCEVTMFLMDRCNVDPMPNLTYIPRGYLFKCRTLRDVCLFEGITFIGMAAFLGSSVHKVTLPKSCEAVAAQAFSGCTNLTELKIENPDIVIDCSAFTQTGDIGWIMYSGTMDQFTNKEWPDEMIEDAYVICFDGTLHMVKGVAKK